MKTKPKPLTRLADGWRLATCDACHQTNYVNPDALPEGAGLGWCQHCRKEQPHVLLNTLSAPAVQ